MKNRPIPTYTIEGTVFQVDVEQLRLVEQEVLPEIISFLSDMHDKGTHYEFAYDKERHCAHPKDDYEHIGSDNYVKVPPLIELDPEGMAEKYGYTVDQLKGKTDFEVIVDQDLLALRNSGALPLIDVCGEPFVVDVGLHQLRHAEDFFPQIDLNKLELNEAGESYCGYYNSLLRQVVDIDPKLTELPAGVVMIEIPHVMLLDPVGIARRNGLDEKLILREFPPQKELKATVTPLNETGLPALVEHNLKQKKQQEQQQTAQRRFRPKF